MATRKENEMRSMHPADHLISLRVNALALRLHGHHEAANRYRAEADEVAAILHATKWQAARER